MTCYDSKEGSFPISYKDCQLLADACEEQIIQMEKNLEEISPEKYLRYKELHQYFLGMISITSEGSIDDTIANARQKTAEINTQQSLPIQKHDSSIH